MISNLIILILIICLFNYVLLKNQVFNKQIIIFFLAQFNYYLSIWILIKNFDLLDYVMNIIFP